MTSLFPPVVGELNYK
uniref:Uncharacterized protein n=1 Tax=Anguilla anguilla TaxID=7936 RepID=A0A0E9QCF3_ANGAN